MNIVRISKRSIWSTLGLILLVYISFLFQEHIVPGMKETFVLETGMTANKSFKLSSAILTTYLLIASSTCLLVNIFKPLNRWNEVGLILGFIFTLTIAIFTGLLGSMAKGFSEGFAPGLIAGFAISIVLPLFMLDEEFT